MYASRDARLGYTLYLQGYIDSAFAADLETPRRSHLLCDARFMS